LKEKNKQTKI